MSNENTRWGEWSNFNEVVDWVRRHASSPVLLVPLDHAVTQAYEDFGDFKVGLDTYAGSSPDGLYFGSMIKLSIYSPDNLETPVRVFAYAMTMDGPNPEGLITHASILNEEQIAKLNIDRGPAH